ncbi:hypothetical protein QBC40DRAFT_250832 [Triangularia verruculosa]|uniref:Uncharacterized protein n=1 Tax=Triangularia verruculosa TaxID=2587418 RepID=A0AAN7AXY3_9PEZI|nr:hypothetical protein QBC40DRAFT_250832 [Triangularia verruculosa]
MKLLPASLIILTTTPLASTLPTPQHYSHPDELVPPPPPQLDTPQTTEDAIFKAMTTAHIATQEEGLGGRKGTSPPPKKSLNTVPPSLRETPVNLSPFSDTQSLSSSTTTAADDITGAFNPKDIWGDGEDNPYDWPRREPDFGSLWRYPRPEPRLSSQRKRRKRVGSKRKGWRHWIFW